MRPAGRWATILLAVMVTALVVTIRIKSLTNDEPFHVAAGYYHLTDGNFRLNAEHPPLVKMIAAVPLVMIGTAAPTPTDTADDTAREVSLTTAGAFWNDNLGRIGRVTFAARLPMIALAIALGWLIFTTTRRWFGERAGLFAVVLFVTEPTVLAHARTVHTDLPAALAYLLFCLAVYGYVQRPGTGKAALAGLATGAACVTKFSLVPVAAALLTGTLVWQLWQRRRETAVLTTVGHALVLIALALLTINAAYRFEGGALSPGDARWAAAQTSGLAAALFSAMPSLTHLVPTYFVFGLIDVAAHDAAGHSASILGQYGDHGWWWYFPVAFALKTSLPFLLLTIVAIVWAVRRAARGDTPTGLVLLPGALYFALAMNGHLNIGVRHILPTFPALFILGGALLDRVWQATYRRTAARATVAALLIAVGADAVRTFPNAMTYMSPLAWRQPHYTYLSDSNVEWGDEVQELAGFLKSRGQTHVRSALLGGWMTLGWYGIASDDLLTPAPGVPLAPYVAIGASFLNGSTVPGGGPGTGRDTREGRVGFFAAYRNRTPEKVFGDSIYLFRDDAGH